MVFKLLITEEFGFWQVEEERWYMSGYILHRSYDSKNKHSTSSLSACTGYSHMLHTLMNTERVVRLCVCCPMYSTGM